jgi:hypothetical protein
MMMNAPSVFIFLSFLFALLQVSTAFQIGQSLPFLSCNARVPSSVRLFLETNNNGDLQSQGDDDDDEEEDPKPYRRRSLRWSNTYRKLIPYEQARQAVLKMGFISKEDWDESVADGRVNPYVPNHPDEMYADEWVSWDEFLGLRRSYEETRSMIQNVLHLLTMEEYTQFIREDNKRAEGLRIPLKPDIVYRDSGWTNADDFFGTLE